MLLTIYNLPGHACYTDVKSLLQEKCGLTDFILDNLVPHMKGKRVTVGLADEQDAAILVRKINGLYLNGQQLYVEDNRKKKQSDQPYRASAGIDLDSQYQALAVNPQHNMMGDVMAAVVNNPMMMNYNMMPVYMPMMPMEHNVPYMGYGGSQIEDPRSIAIVHNEQGPVGFHGEGVAPGNRSREQGHDTFGHRDRNRNPTSERPVDYNRPSRWDEPPRLEPDQDWTAAPDQNWQPEPNRVWDKNNSRREEPNPRWEGDSRRHERDYPPTERFQQNEGHIDDGRPLGQYQYKPDFPRREHGFQDVRERESRHPGAEWNKNDGNDRWDKDRGPNNSEKETTYRHGPAPSSTQHNNPGPKPSISNTYLADERHGDRQLNPPKRNHPEREGGPADWSQIANNYPPSKKPRDNLDKRDIEGPRQSIFAPNGSTNFRPATRAPFQPDAAAPRFTNPTTLPIRPAKPQSVKSKINKDQTCRGQTTATLAKQAMAGSTIGNTELTSRILKELKVCIKGRIDVMLGEELSCNVDDVIARYRLKFSERDDRFLFQMIRYNTCVHHEKTLEVSRGAKSDAVLKPHETESKEEANKVEPTGEKGGVKDVRLLQKTNNHPQTDKQIVKGAKSDAVLKPHETESKEEANKVEPTGEKKAVKEERVLQKTNNPPQTDTQIAKENKQQENLEFNTEDYFKLDPAADNALDDELEKLTDIFARECDNPIDSMDETINRNSVAEFRGVDIPPDEIAAIIDELMSPGWNEADQTEVAPNVAKRKKKRRTGVKRNGGQRIGTTRLPNYKRKQ